MSVGSDKGVKMPASQVIRQGYLRKLKTMKRKYFVLKSEKPENSACLEYYDSEKKWKCQAQPKRIISLKSCFNIQRRLDTKYKHVIALYTKEDCFCVVLDCEEELSSWLNALLTLHHGEEGSDDLPHPRQHVWQVNVQKKGLGASMNILGLYHLCLTDKTITLVKIRPNNTNPIPHDARATDTMEFSLASIRRCGDSECFFYMELGRSAVTGAGELWMHSEDPNIAKSMHATILHAMSNLSSNKDELGPKGRSRSSSANEASKPLFVLARRQTHSGAKSHGLSPSSEIREACVGRGCMGSCLGQCAAASASYGAPATLEQPPPEPATSVPVGAIIRERCDSLPSRHCTQEVTGSSTVAPATLSSFDAGCTFSRSPPPFDKTHHGFDGVSTESIVSTASVDEVDCTAGNEWSTPHLVSKSIPEEETETINASQNEVSSYMEMSTPSVNFKHMLHSGKVSSANHSRTSSLADEGTAAEDCLTLAPPTSDDGYVEMDKSRKRTTSQGGHVSPVSSTCSVTSGTPSTDMRFSEFHLEKVTSYFAPSEEDECGRPIRAYSVGSRPETGVKTNRTGASAIENRVRAFSTGSRNRARPPVGTPPRYLVHPLHSFHHINGFAQTPGHKTTSAPQLPGAAMPPRHTYSSSHGSSEPLDDLMEMDFSNKADSASKTENKINNTRSPVGRSTQLSLPLPITGANSYRNNISATEGYLEMSPGGSNASGYVEMKPADLSSPGSAPLMVPSQRKKSFTRSPPTVSASTTPEGYVEMSWKKHEKKNENQMLTKPITIFANNAKDKNKKLFSTESSPYPTVVSALAESSDDRMTSTSPISSPVASPVTPINSFLNQRRSSKKQQRRNSKEIHTPTGCQSQMIFPFSLNSPGSPMKPFNQKALAETLNRKCSVDASSGTIKLANDYSHDNDIEVTEIINTDYMDMIPGRLSTVKEINEPAYNRIIIENQKSIKQMLNNATKASKAINDMTDYVNLDSSKCSKTTCRKSSQEESFNESPSGDYAIMNPSAMRNVPTESLVVAPKSQNIMRKISDGDSNSARVNILSSNPLASKTMMTAAPNVALDDHRRPIVITATGHLQPIIADFKPIAHDNREPRSIKSCSPKPVESALNRQLAARRPLSRPNSALGETNTPNILECRPSSVNTVLHYASLDLEFTGERSPRPELLSVNSVSSVPTFTYAQIDFVKSEELRNANTVNSNVIASNNVSSVDN